MYLAYFYCLQIQLLLHADPFIQFLETIVHVGITLAQILAIQAPYIQYTMSLSVFHIIQTFKNKTHLKAKYNRMYSARP